MSRDDKFHQKGYDHYLKPSKKERVQPAVTISAPKRAGATGQAYRPSIAKHSIGLKPAMDGLQKNPAVATIALITAGVLFAGGLYAFLPKSQEAQQDIPIIQADLGSFRDVATGEPAVTIPHMESTMLSQIGRVERRESMIEDVEQAERLPIPSDDALMSKEDVIANAMGTQFDEGRLAAATSDAPPQDGQSENLLAQATPQAPAPAVAGQSSARRDLAQLEPMATRSELLTQDSARVVDSAPAVRDEPAAVAVLQKMEDAVDNATISSQQAAEAITPSAVGALAADAAVKAKPAFAPSRQAQAQARPETTANAGTTPDTIAFVRDVLNRNGGQADRVAGELNRLEPAVGVAARADVSNVGQGSLAGGTYYVQLASISDMSRAATEWNAMKAQYSVLKPADYRVQKAAVNGATFYRIQAGPMSKADADRICDSLKAAGKAGGCLVTQ